MIEENKTMKTAALNIMAAVIFAVTFTSCGKGGGDVKLLESITDDSGKVQKKFEYDEQNRIVKMYSYDVGGNLSSTKTITYTDDLVMLKYASDGETIKFVREGNTIEADSRTLTVNEGGYIVEINGSYNSDIYQYQDGNIIKITFENSAEGADMSNFTIDYKKYDDKKSPFFNSNTPKWLLQYLIEGDFYTSDNYTSKNNVLESEISSENTIEYTYEYDSDGFPIKQTREVSGNNNYYETGTTITRYTYITKTKTASAETEPSAEKTEPAVQCNDTLLIDETGIIWGIYDYMTADEAADVAGYVYETNEKFEKLGIKEIDFGGFVRAKVRYLSFALDKGKRSVLDIVDKSFTALLYKKGKEPIEVGLEGHDWEAISKYLQMNPKDVKKKLGYIVKLPISIVSTLSAPEEKFQKKFEYDDQNRIVKIYEGDDFENITTITYNNSDNDVTVGTTSFIRRDDIITVTYAGGSTATLSSNGEACFLLAGNGSTTYQYENCNLIKTVYEPSGDVYYNKFDDKKSPFSSSNTPKWLIQYLENFDKLDACRNNVIESGAVGSSNPSKSEYEYDSDGFPTKRIQETWNFEWDYWMTTTTFYKYIERDR
jgi:hypothetical protein